MVDLRIVVAVVVVLAVVAALYVYGKSRLPAAPPLSSTTLSCTDDAGTLVAHFN